MTWGAIAEAAITELLVAAAGAGVEIVLPLSALAFGAPSNDAITPVLLDLGVTALVLGGPANAPVSGTMVDVPLTMLELGAPLNDGVSGASVDIRPTYTAWADFAIAGGAITEPPPSYPYRAEVNLILAFPANDVVAGTTIDFAPSHLALSARAEELIARSRKVRAIAIAS